MSASTKMAVVIAIAFVLAAVGCSSDSSKSSTPAIVNGKLKVTSDKVGVVINCDCDNTPAPNIGNAAVRQCLHQEQQLMTSALHDGLAIETGNGKITGGGVCDAFVAGPAAWPASGQSATPPQTSGSSPPTCTNATDTDTRCVPG